MSYFFGMERCIEMRFINAIKNGDLNEVKTFWLKQSEIDKPFYLQRQVKIINKSNIYPFTYVSEPTPIVLAILCEQPEILQYMINTFHPSFNNPVNGWYPIHYAACTGDYKCMQVLLQYETVQKNIDITLKTHTGAVSTNTALHVAAANHLHAQALLLTSPLPDIIYDSNFVKYETPVKSTYVPANSSKVTSSGSSPLHSAVKSADIDMVKILLHAKTDINIVNNDQFTALDIAKGSNMKEIIALLEKGVCDEDLMPKYIHDEEKKEDDEKTSVEVEEKLEQEKPVEEFSSKDEVKKLSNSVVNMSMIVSELDRRLSSLENQNRKPEFNVCYLCGNITSSVCNKCGNPICDNCMSSHSC